MAPADGATADGGDVGGQFGCSMEELKALMEYRGGEACDKLTADYGGVLEMCKRLKTSPNEGKSTKLKVMWSNTDEGIMIQ